LFYLGWSLIWGKRAGPNPWGATGLEWATPSPPPEHNFARTPVVTLGPYSYDPEDRSYTMQDGTHYAS
jgi:cytochrome c oxidase subunit 1